MTVSMRIGLGFDVHELKEGYPLTIGGVSIPFEKGLKGHSDADVLVHAIMDALLGALALGDLGSCFPDGDPQYQRADSLLLLSRVFRMIQARQYQLVNLDAIIIAQRPKMKTFLRQMVETLANRLESEVDRISIKATTTEQLGFIGRGKGIAAQVVVLLEKVETSK